MYTRLCAMWPKLSLIAIAGLTGAICYGLTQILSRYVISAAPTWAEQFPLLLTLYVVMLGIAVGVLNAPMHTRSCAALSKVSLQIAVAGLIAVIYCVLAQVFGRYVLNDTPTWAEQTALLLILYVAMLGTAVGVRDAGHIGLESFLVLAPAKLRERLELVIHGLLICFGGIMAYFGTKLAIGQWDVPIEALGLPDGTRYIPLALCGAMMVLFSIEHIIAIIKGTEVEPSWH